MFLKGHFRNNFIKKLLFFFVHSMAKPNISEYLKWQSLFKKYSFLTFYSSTTLLSNSSHLLVLSKTWVLFKCICNLCLPFYRKQLAGLSFNKFSILSLDKPRAYTGWTYCRTYYTPPMVKISDFWRSNWDLHHRSDNYIVIPIKCMSEE